MNDKYNKYQKWILKTINGIDSNMVSIINKNLKEFCSDFSLFLLFLKNKFHTININNGDIIIIKLTISGNGML